MLIYGLDVGGNDNKYSTAALISGGMGGGVGIESPFNQDTKSKKELIKWICKYVEQFDSKNRYCLINSFIIPMECKQFLLIGMIFKRKKTLWIALA